MMHEEFELKGRGVKIAGYHYKVEDPKYVVVLIHGVGEHAGRYHRVADYFSEAGIAIVSMDLRGHGKTEGVRGHCAPRTEVLKDIDCLIDFARELYPGKPVVIYGHSMGGNLVIDYRSRGAYNGDVAGYVISAPWIRLVKNISGALVGVVKLMSRVAPTVKINSSCPEEDLGNPDFVRPYVDDPLVHPYITMLSSYEGFSIGGAIEKGINEDNGRSRGIPCLHMHGTSDKICDVEGSRAYARQSRNAQDEAYTYKEWPGYYHEIHNGGPNGETGEEPILAARDFILGL